MKNIYTIFIGKSLGAVSDPYVKLYPYSFYTIYILVDLGVKIRQIIS